MQEDNKEFEKKLQEEINNRVDELYKLFKRFKTKSTSQQKDIKKLIFNSLLRGMEIQRNISLL